ncbi:MAG: hypothetical protein ACHQ49_17155 [Elusimicrobiota bacterium]
MKILRSIGVLFSLLVCFGCAAPPTRPPAYFGADAREIASNGMSYWEGSARTPAYLSVRMSRRNRAPAREATVYAGSLDLRSSAPVVMRSTFTLTEGASVPFRYEFNVRNAHASAEAGRMTVYTPAALDVVVGCSLGRCWADSKPIEISPEGSVALISKTVWIELRAARKTDSVAEALRKDGECAVLHDRLMKLERGSDLSLERSYERNGCEAWLDEHGGVGAAWRRVRMAQWVTIRGD